MLLFIFIRNYDNNVLLCDIVMIEKNRFFFDFPKSEGLKPPQPLFDEGSAKHSVHQFQTEEEKFTCSFLIRQFCPINFIE